MQATIITRAEAKAAGLKRYFTGEPCREGHVAERHVSIGNCCECHRENKRRWVQENTEKASKAVRRYREENADKVREYRLRYCDENADRVRESRRRHYKENADKERERKRRYREENPKKQREHWAMRRARKRNACPPWVDRKALAAIYADCPDGNHVDHFVPLKGITPDGRPVSGLHVPWNLQYMVGSENLSKKNRMTPDELAELESWRPTWAA